MWIWVNSRSWGWTGRPGVVWFMGSQRVGHDWATELNWTKGSTTTSIGMDLSLVYDHTRGGASALWTTQPKSFTPWWAESLTPSVISAHWVLVPTQWCLNIVSIFIIKFGKIMKAVSKKKWLHSLSTHINFFFFFITSLTLSLASSVQFSSVAQSCPTLCDSMNRSTPGLPVHHQLLEFTQIHIHRVSDAIQPS